MIVLTGSSGGLGSVVLSTILEQQLVPTEDLRISSFSLKSVPKIAKDAGIEVRLGNLYESDTLERAYAGADALFLVSYPSVGPERFQLHKNAIDAAVKAGVKHILYTSLAWGRPGRDEGSVAEVLQAHLNTAKYLAKIGKETGVTWTVIREAIYTHIWSNAAGFVNLDGPKDQVIDAVFPGDGPVHWTDRVELGEGTAKVVAVWKNYINKEVTLTSPKLYTIRQVLDICAARTGHKFNVQVLPENDAIQWHIDHKTLPVEQESFLTNWASMHKAFAMGECNYTDPLLEQLLGRTPKGIEEVQDELFSDGSKVDTYDFVGI